jgi:hypothetical protein
MLLSFLVCTESPSNPFRTGDGSPDMAKSTSEKPIALALRFGTPLPGKAGAFHMTLLGVEGQENYHALIRALREGVRRATKVKRWAIGPRGKRPLTPDNSEVIRAPKYVNRGDSVLWDCSMEIVSQCMGLFEAKDGEVALSVLGTRETWCVKEDDVGSSSGSKVPSRGVMGLGMPGM